MLIRKPKHLPIVLFLSAAIAFSFLPQAVSQAQTPEVLYVANAAGEDSSQGSFAQGEQGATDGYAPRAAAADPTHQRLISAFLEKVQPYWERLDPIVDTQLSLTLTGLTITVAAFMIGSTRELAEEARSISDHNASNPKRRLESLSPEEEQKLSDGQETVKKLLIAFYYFMAMFIATLTVDQWEEIEGIVEHVAWLGGVDFAATSVTFVLGIYYFWQGALAMQRQVIGEQELEEGGRLKPLRNFLHKFSWPPRLGPGGLSGKSER